MLCPTYFYFCPFIWAATGFCVAFSSRLLFADKVRPQDVKHFPKAPVQYDILFNFLCSTHSEKQA